MQNLNYYGVIFRHLNLHFNSCNIGPWHENEWEEKTKRFLILFIRYSESNLQIRYGKNEATLIFDYSFANGLYPSPCLTRDRNDSPRRLAVAVFFRSELYSKWPIYVGDSQSPILGQAWTSIWNIHLHQWRSQDGGRGGGTDAGGWGSAPDFVQERSPSTLRTWFNHPAGLVRRELPNLSESSLTGRLWELA